MNPAHPVSTELQCLHRSHHVEVVQPGARNTSNHVLLLWPFRNAHSPGQPPICCNTEKYAKLLLREGHIASRSIYFSQNPNLAKQNRPERWGHFIDGTVAAVVCRVGHVSCFFFRFMRFGAVWAFVAGTDAHLWSWHLALSTLYLRIRATGELLFLRTYGQVDVWTETAEAKEYDDLAMMIARGITITVDDATDAEGTDAGDAAKTEGNAAAGSNVEKNRARRQYTRCEAFAAKYQEWTTAAPDIFA